MQFFTAKQYLKIDVANSFGLDKLNWDERIDWFDTNEHHLLTKLADAETPAMFYAGVKAWEDVKAGRATGYPVSLDATSSGIQILSVLTGDEAAARLSNVINAGYRSDAYTELYKAMSKKVGNQMMFPREVVKKAIMTAFYGSEEEPKKAFGEGKFLQAFFDTLEEETPYVWELNKAFLAMWDPTALEHSWVMPDNFHVKIKIQDKVQETVEFMGEAFITEKYVNRPVQKGRSIGANVTHSVDGFIVRELVRRCSFSPKQVRAVRALLEQKKPSPAASPSENDLMVIKLWELYEQSGYLSSRILDHLDESSIGYVNRDDIRALLDSMPKKPFKIIPVHDCFRVHPNYGNDLRKQYNLQLALIAKSKMLQFILSQVLKQNIQINKQADLFSQILDADYALS